MKLRVSGSSIKIAKNELIVDGSKNCYTIEFQFDRSWNDMINKTAVFYQPSVNREHPVYKIIGPCNKITIPMDALISNDYLYIGVFGFDRTGRIRLPTVFTYTFVKQGCYKRSEEPDIEPSVYEEIYLMALKAYETSMNVLERADSGEFNGYSPKITVKESTLTSYILTIKTKDDEYDTPNLMATSGDLTYVHHQNEASSEWLVHHEMKKYPSVTVVDSAMNKVVGDVTYINDSYLVIRFSSKFEGTAYLN